MAVDSITQLSKNSSITPLTFETWRMAATGEVCALSKDKLLLFFPKEPNPEWVSTIRAKYPGLQVNWASSVKEDGQPVDVNELPVEYWQGITLLFVDWAPPPAHLLSNVRFVQLASAGADLWHNHPTYLNKDIIFSNASGVYTYVIACLKGALPGQSLMQGYPDFKSLSG